MKRYIEIIAASVIGAGLTLLVSGVVFKTGNNNNNETSEPVNVKMVQQPVVTKVNSNYDFVNAAEKTVHAVVHVKVRNQYAGYENPFYNFLFGKPVYPQEQAPVVSAGSGVIISNDGYIVTNNHVIEGADILEVTLNDKRTFTAKVIGADANTDIALIKIDGTGFPFLEWGDSDNLRIGEWVLAVGNPFNLASTVTAGIVSAKARSINILNKRTAIESFIQTDAAVNPGNSGGALVNTDGKLVGINTAIASPTGTFSGYSFAVPQRIAQKIVNDFIEFGAIQRAFLGVSITEVTSDEAKKSGVTVTNGVFVSAVANGGAAAEGGVKAGDVIIDVAGVKVNSTSELQEQVGQFRPGDQINVTVLRQNNKKTMLLTLRNINGSVERVKAMDKIELLGAEFKIVDPSTASKLRIKGGVQIVSVNQGKFASAGIKDGFIIVAINRKQINTLDDLQFIIQNSTGGIYVEGVYPNGITAYYAFGI